MKRGTFDCWRCRYARNCEEHECSTQVCLPAETRQSRLVKHNLVEGDPAAEIARIKQAPGPDLTLLGSGTIVAQLAAADLVDDVQLLICPIVLGSGKSQFAGVAGRPGWTLSRSRTFKNGRVFLAYSRAR